MDLKKLDLSFINESNSIKELDTFVEVSESSKVYLEDLNEDDLKDKKNEGVLGKIKGEFFFPNGISRNKRFYPKTLWENALSRPEVISALSERRMLGTVGHDQAIDDQAIKDGNISHVVTKLYIDESTGKGMGEAVILNTSSGKNLHALLKGGVKLYVSTRGRGTFSNQKHEGMPVVDENTYRLQTVDIVSDPGFLSAVPSLIENNKKSMEYNYMNVKENADLFETVTKQKIALENANEALIEENKQLTGDNAVATKEANEAKAKLEEASAELAAYRELASTPDELREGMASIKENVELLNSRIEDLTSDLEEANTTLEGYEEIGADLESVKALGEAMTILNDLGITAKTAPEMVATLEAYDKIGADPESVAVLGEYVEGIQEEKEKAELAAKVEGLANELGQPAEKIAKLLEKLSEDEIREAFDGVVKETSSNVSESWKITGEEETVEETKEESTKVSKLNGLSRLAESFYRD